MRVCFSIFLNYFFMLLRPRSIFKSPVFLFFSLLVAHSMHLIVWPGIDFRNLEDRLRNCALHVDHNAVDRHNSCERKTSASSSITSDSSGSTASTASASKFHLLQSNQTCVNGNSQRPLDANANEPIYAVVNLKNKYELRAKKKLADDAVVNFPDNFILRRERPNSFHVNSGEYEEVRCTRCELHGWANPWWKSNYVADICIACSVFWIFPVWNLISVPLYSRASIGFIGTDWLRWRHWTWKYLRAGKKMIFFFDSTKCVRICPNSSNYDQFPILRINSINFLLISSDQHTGIIIERATVEVLFKDKHRCSSRNRTPSQSSAKLGPRRVEHIRRYSEALRPTPQIHQESSQETVQPWRWLRGAWKDTDRMQQR